jgi:hypothetical protein
MSLKSASKCTGEIQNNTDAWSHSVIQFGPTCINKYKKLKIFVHLFMMTKNQLLDEN